MRTDLAQVAAKVAKKEDAQIEAQRISHGWVTDINPDNTPPTTIMLGPGNHPAWTIDNAAYAVGDQVVAMHTGSAYVILGKVDLAVQNGTPATHDHPHVHAGLTLLNTIVGDGTTNTLTLPVPAGIPARHLLVMGRTSHANAVPQTNFIEGRIRLGSAAAIDTGANYYATEHRTVSSGNQTATDNAVFNGGLPPASGSALDFFRIVVGTGSGIIMWLPDYRGPSSFNVVHGEFWAVHGSTPANGTFTHRSLGGRWDGAEVGQIRFVCTAGENWNTTFRVSLYGLE